MSATRALVAGWLLAITAPAFAQGTPLFQQDSPLRLTIQGPLPAILANRADEAGRPGVLVAGSERLPIALAPRGITRRSKEVCDFPPLRVDFTTPPPPTSIFTGQRRLKLVTHCRRSEGHQQYVLLEYAAYRMYNQLTPLSFRVRLAQLDYRDASGRPMVSRVGFFIEDAGDVARRNGLPRFQAGDRIPPTALSPKEAALAAMFEYMISNLDWSMRAGPAGEGCCHNFRLLTGANGKAVPVPYDFDHAGLVDPPYATPPEGFNLPSVRVRNYRGYCLHNAEALAAAQGMRAKQAELTATLASTPGLAPQVSRKAVAYLQTFLAQIATDDSVRERILRNCVR